ncbi:MAG TPA: recombination protein NinG, partial [Pricia sp.]|nr:recombination protein NinG [Pricia sp.]
ACIATGNFGKMNGGHYLSVGANRTTAYNLHNIFIQSFESNTFRGGDDKNYQYGLKEIFGRNYFDFVHSLRRCPALHLTKDDLREVKKNAKIVLKRLKENRKIRHPEERVRERNRANKVIGIYPDDYGTFRLEKLELDSTKQ